MSEGTVIPVGAKVTVQGKLSLGQGTVRYVGLTKFQTGRWVGIELETALGKNDGEVQGVRYFQCPPEHGIFVKPSQVILSESAEAEAPSSPSVATKKPAPSTTTTTTTTTKSELKKPSTPPTSSSPSTPRKASTSSATAESGIKKTASSPTVSKLKPPSSSSKTTTTTSKTSATTSPTTSKLKPPGSLKSVASAPKTLSSPASPASASPAQPSSPAPSSPAPSSPSSPRRVPSPTLLSSKLEDVKPATKEKEPEEDDEEGELLAGDFPDDDDEDHEEAIDEDEEEEEEKEKEKPVVHKEKPAEPEPAPAPVVVPEVKKEPIKAPEVSTPITTDSSVHSESVNRMMQALKELNEFKANAQDTIQKLQHDLAEETSAKNKLVKEHEKEIQKLTRERESEAKQAQKQGVKDDKLQQLQQAWEKEKQDLQEQLNALSENMEMIALDKEIAEEKVESLESELLTTTEELEQATIQLKSIEDEKKARLESLKSDGGGSGNTEECLALMEQNEKLKDALVKLRDFSVNEKQDAAKKIKELEKSAKLVPSLEEKVTKLESDLTEKLGEIDELKQLVDDANAAQDLIDELSDKNLNLTEKVEELQSTIQDLEDLRSLSEEVEESQKQLERDLRSSLHKKEMELLNREGDLANWQLKCGDQEKTISQFRDLVNKLQREIAKMREAALADDAQKNEIASREKTLMSMNLQLQTQVMKGTALEVAQHLDRIKTSEAQLQTQFLRSFVPEKQFQPDNDAIRLVILAKRMSAKTDLLKALLQKIYKHEEVLARFNQDNVDEETVPSSSVSHALQVEYLVSKLGDISADLTDTLAQCPVEVYLHAGKSTYEAELLEKSVDPLLVLLRDEQFGPNYHIEDLEKMVQRFETLKTAQLTSGVVRPAWRTMQSEVNAVSYLMMLLLVESAKLNKPESPKQKIVQVYDSCRKLNKQLSPNARLQSSPIVNEALVACTQSATKMRSVFKQVVGELVDSAPEQWNGILNKNFAELVTELQGDEEGRNKMELALSKLDNSLRDVIETILAGDLDLPPQTEKEATPTPPWVTRGQQAQAQLSEVGSLKEKLSQKEVDNVDLQKLLKVKEQDIQEEKYKVETQDKYIRAAKKTSDELAAKLEQEAEKLGKQEKMYEEALESMRKDHATLEQENRSLKSKLANADKSQRTASLASFGAALSQVAVGGSVQVSNQELEALKTAIRHLRAENSRLKAELSERELNTLLTPEPLPGKITANDVIQSTKELTSYLSEVRLKLATTKVVDLRVKADEPKAKAPNMPQSNKAVEALQRSQLEAAVLQRKGVEIREKLLKLVGEANTSFANFPSPVTTTTLKNLQPVLVGKVVLPQSRPQTKPTHVLFSKPREFEQVHSVFVR